MTTLDAAASGNPNRLDNRPPKPLDWAMKHVTLIGAVLSVLAACFGAINTLKEHGEKIDTIQSEVRDLKKDVEQINKDTGYLSGRLDSKGQDRR